MLFSLLLTPLEKIINKILALDQEKAELLVSCAGKVLQIELLPMKYRFYIEIGEQVIYLKSTFLGQADTVIRGSPLALLTLIKQKNLFKLPELVSITGNLELPQMLRNIFNQIEIDWEEHLAQVVGDPTARLLSNQLRRLKNWQQNASASLLRNSREYLQEEVRYFPPRAELNDFFEEIDAMQLAVERMAARVQRLTQSELAHE